MKKPFPQALAALVVVTMVCGARPGFAANLDLRFAPVFDGKPFQFDSLTNLTAAGQTISVTRLDFLLSNIGLRREDGTWVEQTNWFAFVNAHEGKTGAQLENAPTGRYDRVRFLIGLKPDINHSKAAEYPAGHPLNPDVNGLHWGWMGGYVFLALEGNWLQSDGMQSGFSYHLANDRQLMTIELPVSLNTASDCELRLALDVARIFGQTNPIVIDASTTSTHSRAEDLLASRLRSNCENAFTVTGVSSTPPAHQVSAGPKHIEMAADATPYRLTISAFFPRPELPADNPLTEEGVALGRRLFSDPRLSINNSQSCASCHNPSGAFVDGRNVSIGAEGSTGSRNAMGLLNLAWKSSFFWDGRAATLREQVLQPIQNPVEMHESLTNVAAKLQLDHEYPALFARAFGHQEINGDRIARALEQFLLSQVSYDSKFDRVISSEAKFTAQEQRGFTLFHTEYDPRREQYGADCFHCHGGPLFQSQSFANNGLDKTFTDLGRYAVTGRKGDEGKFAVPSLRNIELTAPYMHDGRIRTLEQAVEHYCTGMQRSPTLDPNLAKHPDGGLPLSPEDKRALVAFLKTLTDERFRGQTVATLARSH